MHQQIEWSVVHSMHEYRYSLLHLYIIIIDAHSSILFVHKIEGTSDLI